MTNRYRFTNPPKDLSRRHVRLDNIALLPGDLLPFRETWEKIAGNLPVGSSLIVLPPSRHPQRRLYETIANRLRSLGRPIRLITAEQVFRRKRYEHIPVDPITDRSEEMQKDAR